MSIHLWLPVLLCLKRAVTIVGKNNQEGSDTQFYFRIGSSQNQRHRCVTARDDL